MILIVKLFIIIIIFILTLWLQCLDDKKYNKVRSTLYDKYKLPIFSSSCVGLLLNVSSLDNNLFFASKQDMNQDIYLDPLYKFST